METVCINHPTSVAVERCEVCAQPLCGYCVWYTEKEGHRLCQTHARERADQGERILPPESYEEVGAGMFFKEASAGSSATSPADTTANVYHGNNYDLSALLAATVGLVTLLSCCGGAYCLPFGALGLGLLAFLRADRAVDPGRARSLAGFGLVLAGLLLLAVAALVAFYLLIVVLALQQGPG